MTSLYDRIGDLPLTVDGYGLERHEMDTSGSFTRVSTVVTLRGEDDVGRGEDVTYDTPDHGVLHAAHDAGTVGWDLAGESPGTRVGERVTSRLCRPSPVALAGRPPRHSSTR